MPRARRLAADARICFSTHDDEPVHTQLG